MRKDINGKELHPDDEHSIVRNNLLTIPGYTGYCGSPIPRHMINGCNNPRTEWIPELNQFRCPHCGLVTQFPADFYC